MKKYCFFIMLLFAGTVSFGQSLDEINKLMILGQNKKAKEGVDKFMADAKNAKSTLAWFYKGRIYNTASKDSGLSAADAMKLKAEAFEALKKYQQMDTKEEAFVQENHATYFDLYNGYFDIGAKEFNAKNFRATIRPEASRLDISISVPAAFLRLRYPGSEMRSRRANFSITPFSNVRLPRRKRPMAMFISSD